MRLTMSKAAIPLYCVWPFVPGRESPAITRRARPTLLGQAWHGTVGKMINTGEYNPGSVVKDLQIPGEYEQNVADVVSMFPLDHAARTLEQHPGANAEVSFAFAPATGSARILGVDLNRAYAAHGALESDIVGTADVVWTENCPSDMSRVPGVRDWKVVFGQGLHVDPIDENPQLLWLALCAMRVHGASRSKVEVVQVYQSGNSRLEDYTVSQRAAAMMVRKVLNNVQSADEKTLPRPGRHCVDHYCPMLGVCPAVHEASAACSEAVTQLPVTRMPIVVEAGRIRNDDHAVFLLHIARQVKRASEMMIAACQEYVRKTGRPLDTGNGMQWGPVREHRSAIVAASVEELAQVIAPFVGGYSAAREMVRAGITKQKLEQSVSVAAGKGNGAASMRQCEEELRKAAMLVDVHCGEKFTERKPKDDN